MPDMHGIANNKVIYANRYEGVEICDFKPEENALLPLLIEHRGSVSFQKHWQPRLRFT